MSDCKSKTECDTKSETSCPVEKSASQTCCPVEASVEKWSASFCQAMQCTQVDILKEKIRQRWGDTMDQVADRVIDSMEVHWASVLQQAKARKDLRENVGHIFFAEKK